MRYGARLLRLCGECAQTELGRELIARPRPPEEEESSEVGRNRWIQLTAVVVVLAFIAPLVIDIFSR